MITPWYRNHEYYFQEAELLLNAIIERKPDKSFLAEYDSFKYHCSYRMVFESNLIEGEGTTLGKTQEIIQAYFPLIPSNYATFRRISKISKDPFQTFFNRSDYEKMINAISIYNNKLNKLIPSIIFENKTKDFIQVLQHYIALIRAESISMKFQADWLSCNDSLNIAIKERKYYFDNDGNFCIPIDNIPKLLTIEKIHEIHEILSKYDPLFADKSKRGTFRSCHCHVSDPNVIFPSPENINNAMNAFVNNSNNLIYRTKAKKENPFITAAKISYDFVRIHPFADYNGRLSRILIYLCLNAFGHPFPLCLRGDKKARHQYSTALRRANNGNYLPMAAFIAKRVFETYKEFSNILTIIGSKPLIVNIGE